jgi:CheY-like chemotaxis protein
MPSVLVVDDEASVRNFAARVLEHAGFDVACAADGPEALRIDQSHPAFDLYLLDVMMPQMRGDEVARRLRLRRPDVKILYFTGYRERLCEHGPQTWANEQILDKPATVDRLIESVTLVLKGEAGAPAPEAPVDAAAAERLIAEYYRAFNERRFEEAARLFASDAVLDHIPFGRLHRGVEGYLHFAHAWEDAFPDSVFTIDRIERRGESLFDVHLTSVGTHSGVLDIGIFVFRPTGTRATLRLRELLDIRGRVFESSNLTLDVNDLISQLSVVDYAELTKRLARIREMSDELAAAGHDRSRQKDLAERLGLELDAARRALRPHYR